MPLIRKIVQIGRTKGITLPKSWLSWVREQYGEVNLVEIEVNEELRIKPHISKVSVDCKE